MDEAYPSGMRPFLVDLLGALLLLEPFLPTHDREVIAASNLSMAECEVVK